MCYLFKGISWFAFSGYIEWSDKTHLEVNPGCSRLLSGFQMFTSKHKHDFIICEVNYKFEKREELGWYVNC